MEESVGTCQTKLLISSTDSSRGDEKRNSRTISVDHAYFLLVLDVRCISLSRKNFKLSKRTWVTSCLRSCHQTMSEGQRLRIWLCSDPCMLPLGGACLSFSFPMAFCWASRPLFLFSIPGNNGFGSYYMQFIRYVAQDVLPWLICFRTPLCFGFLITNISPVWLDTVNLFNGSINIHRISSTSWWKPQFTSKPHINLMYITSSPKICNQSFNGLLDWVDNSKPN